jgi:uncharacterized protein YndB with AHSA1/START domain
VRKYKLIDFLTLKNFFMPDKQKLQIETSLKIQKPVHDVFEAIVDPKKISNYFISKSSGRIEQGKTVTWKFPEMDIEFPIRVNNVQTDKFISYDWDNFEDGVTTTVEIELKPIDKDETFVTVSEKSRDNDEAGIKWLKGNTGGWANFLACLKAWLEYGINLRKGAIEVSQLPKNEAAV